MRWEIDAVVVVELVELLFDCFEFEIFVEIDVFDVFVEFGVELFLAAFVCCLDGVIALEVTDLGATALGVTDFLFWFLDSGRD